MNTTDQATPRPWGCDGRTHIDNDAGAIACIVPECPGGNPDARQANVDLIIKAVNEYAALRKLEKFLKKLSFGNEWDAADAAKLLADVKAARTSPSTPRRP
jgi:hypothetical protein